MLQTRTSGASLQSLFQPSRMLVLIQCQEFGLNVVGLAVVDLAKDP